LGSPGVSVLEAEMTYSLLTGAYEEA